MRQAIVTLCCVAGLAASARAQVVISEVFQNPPSTDEVWEYIELYGKPGMSLNGYVIASIKGGRDTNGDNVPDTTGGDDVPEIDECFSLNGLTLGSNGFLVLYNGTSNNNLIPTVFPANVTGANLADWKLHNAPNSPDTPGKLNDAGSSTYVLVRGRSNPNAFVKDTNPDLNFDSQVDFGDEVGPFYGGTTPAALQPFQLVDCIAWSSDGGKEYGLSGDDEISESPGFDPDAVTRVAYYISNPNRGARTKATTTAPFFEVLPTRTGDESFVYGEIEADAVFAPYTLNYDTSIDLDGYIQSKGPTNPAGPAYDGSCDPEPDGSAPDPGCTPTGGSYRFADVNLAGFHMSPGSYNDGGSVFQVRFERAQAQGSLPPGFNAQFIAKADFNMDGAVDCDDLQLITSRLGATLDDTVPALSPNGTPYSAYKWQMGEFQQILMMLDMNQTDGGGGSNAASVTAQDVAAVEALVSPSPCVGDVNGDGFTNSADFNVLAGNFGSAVPLCTGGDLNHDGQVNSADFNILAGNFGCGS